MKRASPQDARLDETSITKTISGLLSRRLGCLWSDVYSELSLNPDVRGVSEEREEAESDFMSFVNCNGEIFGVLHKQNDLKDFPALDNFYVGRDGRLEDARATAKTRASDRTSEKREESLVGRFLSALNEALSGMAVVFRERGEGGVRRQSVHSGHTAEPGAVEALEDFSHIARNRETRREIVETLRALVRTGDEGIMELRRKSDYIAFLSERILFQ